MYAHEIVVHHVERDGMRVVLNLLRESIAIIITIYFAAECSQT